MRARHVVTAALLLLPAVVSAQVAGRRPPVGRGPDRPAPLPPHAPGIQDNRLYTASRFAFESYPMLSFVQTDRYVTDNGPASYLMQGEGMRIEWRMKPTFSLATDITSALFGGPFQLHTFEFGGRYRPLNENDGARPFFDLRGTWAYAYDSYAQPYNGSSFALMQPDYARGSRTTSQGFGGLIGTGFESPITRSLTLAAGLSVSSYGMSSVRLNGQQFGSDLAYQATVVRLTFGVNYNPHYMISR